MSTNSVQSLVASLSSEHRANLANILDVEGNDTASICEELRWLYHSKVRKEVRAKGHAAANVVLSKTTGKHVNPITDEDYPPPSWAELIEGLARALKVHDASAELSENEAYICDKVIALALQKMRPKERRQFFGAGLDVASVVQDAPPRGNLKGPLRAAGALGAANALGFSLYTSAATALSFVTHAVGISLPFAAYAGMSSAIAAVIGPVGWLGVGFYTFYRLTSANWKKLTPAIIYLIQAKEAALLDRLPLESNAQEVTR